MSLWCRPTFALLVALVSFGCGASSRAERDAGPRARARDAAAADGGSSATHDAAAGACPQPSPVRECGGTPCGDVASDPGAVCPEVCCTAANSCGTHNASDRQNEHCAPPYVNHTQCPDTEYGLGCCVNDTCGLMRAYVCWPRQAWVLSIESCDGKPLVSELDASAGD